MPEVAKTPWVTTMNGLCRNISSSYLMSRQKKSKIGARVEQVDELRFGSVVVWFELEAYPEPKVLSPVQLKSLYDRFKSFVKAGVAIGMSEGFVRQNAVLARNEQDLTGMRY